MLPFLFILIIFFFSYKNHTAIIFFLLFFTVLPHVAKYEKKNRYDTVTLLFSGIVGFAQYCAANTDAEGAMKIVKMLNELYTIFDALCDTKRIPNIYKVSKMLCSKSAQPNEDSSVLKLRDKKKAKRSK